MINRLCSISKKILSHEKQTKILPPRNHAFIKNLTVCRRKKINFKMKYWKIFHTKNAWIEKTSVEEKFFKLNEKLCEDLEEEEVIHVLGSSFLLTFFGFWCLSDKRRLKAFLWFEDFLTLIFFCLDPFLVGFWSFQGSGILTFLKKYFEFQKNFLKTFKIF